MKANKLLIIDFGSQYTQLIARRVRELGVLSIVISIDDFLNYKKIDEIFGIILISLASLFEPVYDIIKRRVNT